MKILLNDGTIKDFPLNMGLRYIRLGKGTAYKEPEIKVKTKRKKKVAEDNISKGSVDTAEDRSDTYAGFKEYSE